MPSTVRSSSSSRTGWSLKPWPTTPPIVSMRRRPVPTSPCKPTGSAPISPTLCSSAASIDSRPVASIGRSSASIVQSPSPAMTRKRTSRMRSSDSPPSAMPSGRPMESFSLQGGRVHPDLEALLVLQAKDVAVTSCDARLRALEPEIRQLDEQVAGGRESAVLERERTSRGVNPALLARYDRIRRGKAPLAIYPLHGSSCGNCFTAVPTQRKALIQRGATIEGCEACGVLLYAKE